MRTVLSKWFMFGLLSASLVGCANMAKPGEKKDGEKKEEKKDEKEVKMTLDQVPAAVKATLLKEAGDAKIGNVDKVTDDGKTIYETDIKVGGKEFEIKVAEDGKLISKKLEEDEKDEKKGEKKEDKKEDKK